MKKNTIQIVLPIFSSEPNIQWFWKTLLSWEIIQSKSMSFKTPWIKNWLSLPIENGMFKIVSLEKRVFFFLIDSKLWTNKTLKYCWISPGKNYLN